MGTDMTNYECSQRMTDSIVNNDRGFIPRDIYLFVVVQTNIMYHQAESGKHFEMNAMEERCGGYTVGTTR
jgi:hypothetical protein